MQETVRDPLSAFAGVSPRLFGIAYRMLGSVSEAEDIVQEVWLWWQTADRSSVKLTAVARLSSDVAAGLKTERSSPPATGFPPPA